MLPTRFRFNWPNGFREESKKSANQKQESMAAMSVTDRDEISTLYRGPSIDASYQISVHLGKRFQRRRFFQKSTNQKQEWPVAAMFVNGSELNEQCLQKTFHRCFLPSFGSFGQAVSEEKIFKNRPIRNKNCLWRPCLLMDRDKLAIFIKDLPQMLPTKFQFIWLRGFRGED